MPDKFQNHIDPVEVLTESLPKKTRNETNEVSQMENQTGIGTGNLNYTEASIQEYKEGVGLFQEVMPDVVNGYNDFTGACFKEGTVSEKDKQLIATGISVYSRDEYCIMYHTKMALEKGATPEEIMESVAVASALGGGTAFSQGVTLVMDVLQQYQNQIH